VKCPKCDYLGFETGDRCRNCGYDFSFLNAPDTGPVDLPLREPESSSRGPAVELTLLPAVSTAPEPGAAAASLPRPRSADAWPLPLFNSGGLDDDAPLIKLPAAPRPPLAVRRAPELPRLRAVPRPARRAAADVAPATDPEPILAFVEEDASQEAPKDVEAPARSSTATPAQTTSPARRATAAAVDHVILVGIDAIVLYFTFRLAEVSIGEWRLVPVLPFLVFLGMLKAAYFYVFTLVGGQTIGKMAAHIRVIAEDGRGLDPARVIRRTLAGAVSVITLGLAFLPALITPDRRALHDRVAGTRVVEI
jgi:uncharacterized RDD family membrane protein YckC